VSTLINTFQEMIKTEIVESYMWYDGPLFYLIKTEKGQMYICYLIARQPTDDKEFLVPVTLEEVEEMKTSNIREWFLKQYREHKLYRYTINFEAELYNVEQVEESNYDPTEFPTSDFYMDKLDAKK